MRVMAKPLCEAN